MFVQTTENSLASIKEIIDQVETSATNKLLIVSTGDFSERGRVIEFYGNNFKTIWNNFLSAYKINQFNQAPYLRIDILTKETKIDFTQFLAGLKKVRRNNYVDFNVRIDGLRKRSFLMEELVANAILKPSKAHKVGKNLPDLQIDEQNYRGYVKRKYGRNEQDLSYLQRSDFYLFETKSYYFEEGQLLPIKDYGNGNRIREISRENLAQMTDLVIAKGSSYLENQLTSTGKFIYGYYPCYDQPIKGYNSVRHFSSLYALAEAAEYFSDQKMLASVKDGLLWGMEHLTVELDDYLFIKEQLTKDVEYKLGAQATAILAVSKYVELTQDEQFHSFLQELIRVVEDKFLTAEKKTIHVLDGQLQVKEQFRIVYYDGEILFALLRAYEILKQQEILTICEGLMAQFVANNYQKYHDHWLSYATNELLKYQQKKEYYQFGLKNALENINFIDKRDTAYPTMLELLVAASKMMTKLEVSPFRKEIFPLDEDFFQAKSRINQVMEKRALHEITTGVMFPEFAQFFKQPAVVCYGFFARHDRFRMRIDDAEHFLSGLINYRMHTNKEEGF
ncbi:hypothetical protein [Enterococcus sp. DIV0180]|uniref:hypothetical protein n=1 Tax=Enterococcus sp. DIV0180 TaxID=2774749 RepID=UPI003D2FA820